MFLEGKCCFLEKSAFLGEENAFLGGENAFYSMRKEETLFFKVYFRLQLKWLLKKNTLCWPLHYSPKKAVQ